VPEWFDGFVQKIPPPWKIQREWRRLKSQSTRGLRNLYEPFIQRHHDANFSRRVVVHPGAQAATARVAILLIWQRAALPRSLELTLATLKRSGFCTVVVSNSTLVPETLTVLAQNSVAVLERPNFGYDFGGYRDGVRFVFESIPSVETLLILNDSTWFPLRADDQTIDRMLRDPAPYKGLVNKQVVHKARERKHLESHFLMFEAPVLRHAAFHDFWTGYRVSSDRYNTIRRGEYGISTAVTSAGFPMVGVIDPWKFVNTISQLSPLALREVLANAVPVGPDRIAEVRAALQEHKDSESWRDKAATMIAGQIWKEEHLVTTAYIYAGLRYLDYPYLKKRREPLVTVTRVKALEMLDKGIIRPIAPEVEAEVRRTV
jgi:hypothetical protein